MGWNERKQEGGWRERGRVWVGMRGNRREDGEREVGYGMEQEGNRREGV